MCRLVIGYDIIENGNGVSGNSKNPNMGNFGRQGDTYAVVGQQSNLVCVGWSRMTPHGCSRSNTDKNLKFRNQKQTQVFKKL